MSFLRTFGFNKSTVPDLVQNKLFYLLKSKVLILLLDSFMVQHIYRKFLKKFIFQ